MDKQAESLTRPERTSANRQSFDSISNIDVDDMSDAERSNSTRLAWLENVDQEELKLIEQLAAEQATVDVPLNSKKLKCCCCDLYTLWKFTGPGWLMSIAYLDPGNLEADLQSGAYTGYQLLWMLFWATIMGLLLQVLAARLGVVTGKNLAQMCRLEYSKPTSILLWLMTETAIIGSDIQEVLGSAIALKLLFGLPLWVGCLVTGLDTFTFLVIHAYGVRKLEAFFAALIFTMMICFFINFGLTGPVWLGGPWEDNGGGILLGTLIPTVNDYAVIQCVGILGAVIMPHNIYLHSALVQSRNINRKNSQAVEEACKYNAIESSVALLISFFINAAVVTVFAAGFFADSQCAEAGWNNFTWNGQGPRLSYGSNANLGCYTGKDAMTEQFDACHRLGPANATNSSLSWMKCTNSQGIAGVCCSVGLQNAGQALEGLLGSHGKIVWAIGLLAAGQASTMTGTFAGQYVMEGFLNWKVSPVVRVTITRSIALGPAIAVGLYMSTNSAAGDILNEWLNILQSVQLPFALLPVLHFTSSPRLMGEFANKGWINYTCWSLAALVIGINIYLVENFITDPNSPTPYETWFFILVSIIGLLYISFICIVISDDIKLGWSKIQIIFGGNRGAQSGASVVGRAFRGNQTPRRGSGVKAAGYSIME